MKLAILAMLCLLPFQSFAYEIKGHSYDPYHQVLTVTLVFEGGKKPHKFSTQFTECRGEQAPYQMAARLIDSGWDDTGKDLITQKVQIDLSHSDCLPAELTVFASRKHITVLVY